jgi:hypothetical protein
VISFPPSGLSQDEERLRDEVRSFLAEEISTGQFQPGLGIGTEPSTEFSKRLAAKGWLGMVVPVEYGGPGRSAVERFLVAEELLAAGAPVNAHWVGDRQTAQMILAFGTEQQRKHFLPKIVNSEVFFALGLSEPASGSDLASVTTRGERVDGGWIVNGLKTWTSGAHFADYAVSLCRTSPLESSKHAGLSQFIIDLRAEGVTVSPILLLNGQHHFNEVLFEDVFVPDEMVLGEVGSGWNQVTSELAYERSGPDRFLSALPLLRLFLQVHKEGVLQLGFEREIGRLFSRFWVLHHMSLSIARSLDSGNVPALEAALTKDIGTKFEQEVVRVVRQMVARCGRLETNEDSVKFEEMLVEATITAPTFTLRGGTNEVLRMIAAKQLQRAWGGTS